MKNILLDSPPCTVLVNGIEYPINSGFRTGITFESMIIDGDVTAQDILDLWYPNIPQDPVEALKQVLWFYRCGKEEDPAEEKHAARKHTEAYDFEQDADQIYTSFREAYGIDLTCADMHWWIFRKLMIGLPEDTQFKKIVHYRVADTKGMSKTQKKQYAELKKRFEIKRNKRTSAAISLIERNNRWIAYVNQRYAEAGVSD